MKKLSSLILVLVLTVVMLASATAESEDMRAFYNPEGYDLISVSDIFVGEEDIEVVQGCFGTVDMSEGEDNAEFVGFDEEKVFSLFFAEDAVVEMPADLENPVENAPVESFADLVTWFEGFKAAYGDTESFLATFEMNEAGELTALSYCYMP